MKTNEELNSIRFQHRLARKDEISKLIKDPNFSGHNMFCGSSGLKIMELFPSRYPGSIYDRSEYDWFWLNNVRPFGTSRIVIFFNSEEQIDSIWSIIDFNENPAIKRFETVLHLPNDFNYLSELLNEYLFSRKFEPKDKEYRLMVYDSDSDELKKYADENLESFSIEEYGQVYSGIHHTLGYDWEDCYNLGGINEKFL